MVSRHCVSANHQQGSKLKLERLTICMVSDEEMAKVLSQPGYSHLNGSEISHRSTLEQSPTYSLVRVDACEQPAAQLPRTPDHRRRKYTACDRYAIANAAKPFGET